MSYSFRKAVDGEAEKVYAMIADRVRWMNEVDIHHWNTLDYLKMYPLSYYQKNLSQIYVLMEEQSSQMLSAAVLLEEDIRWVSEEPALYVHNFVSIRSECGWGKIFLQEVEQYARQLGKAYLRLDSSTDNEELTRYYEALGFAPCGFCHEGEYYGTLRQKKLV